jgi:phosphoribosylaminoimidazole-succinocarboxamide synthase
MTEGVIDRSGLINRPKIAEEQIRKWWRQVFNLLGIKNTFDLTSLGNRIAEGSSKDILEVVNVWTGEVIPGILCFLNRNGFSVFDFGDLKMLIPNKGMVEAMMTFLTFKHLESLGISTHLVGLRDPKTGIISTEELISSAELIVSKFLRPDVKLLTRQAQTVDNTTYDAKPDFLRLLEAGEKVIIPVEAIMRSCVIGGVSSVTKSDESWSRYRSDNPNIDLPTEKPVKGQIIDFSTW